MDRETDAPAGRKRRSPSRFTGIWTAVLGPSALVLLWVLLPGGATADPPPAAQSPESKPALDTVTIEARKQREMIEHQISSFVSSIVIHPGDESMARWTKPVCPLVAGLPHDKGEFVLSRLSQVAREAGMRLGPEKCEANFFVIVTPEPEVLLQKWWDQNPRLFNPDRGIGGVKRFIGTPRPIRLWYNVNSRCSGGILTMTYNSGGMAVPTCSHGGLGSRLVWETVRGIGSVIVVVDLKRIEDLNLGQMTDYVAMIGFAHIKENVAPDQAPTILRLFTDTGAARPQSLSNWDQSLLKALYTTDQQSVTQLADIKFRLYRDLIPTEMNASPAAGGAVH